MSSVCRFVGDHWRVAAPSELDPGSFISYDLVHIDPKYPTSAHLKRRAHDTLRRLVVGRELQIKKVGKHTYSVRIVGEVEDVSCKLLRTGLTRPYGDATEAKLPEPYWSAWLEGQDKAIEDVESPVSKAPPSLQKLLKECLESKKERTVTIDAVESAATLCCYLSEARMSFLVHMTGVKTLQGLWEKEAKEFLEARVLQRDLMLRLDGQKTDGSQQAYYGTFTHSTKGNVAIHLLRQGLVMTDIDTIVLLKMAQQESLRNAALQASRSKVGLWKINEQEKDQATTAATTPANVPLPSAAPAQTQFYAKIADIFSGTCMMFVLSKVNPLTTTRLVLKDDLVTPFDELRTVYLTHVRCSNRGWRSASRQLIIDFCGAGRFIWLQIDSIHYPPAEFAGRSSDEFGRIHRASIFQVDKHGTIKGPSLNLELVRAGLATVDIFRDQGHQPTAEYEIMLRIQKAQQPTAPPQTPKFNDYTGPLNVKRAKQLWVALQNEDWIEIFIERIVSGSAFRAYLPSFKALVSITLSGITCPRQTLATTHVSEDDEDAARGPPFSEECMKWAQLNLLFRSFSAKMTNCDPTGAFGAKLLTKDKQSVQDIMLREGMALVFDRYPGVDEQHNRACEAEAVAAARGIWSLADNVKYFGRGQSQSTSPSVVGSWGSVNVSHCESATEIYVQKHSQFTSLADVQKLITSEMASSENHALEDFPPARNSIVLALYEDIWYRAKIMGTDNLTGAIQVFFLDYGNQSIVSKASELAVLPAACNVIAYEPLAHRVALAHVKNTSIDPDALERCCELIMDFGEDQTSKCDCLGMDKTYAVPDVVITRGSRNLSLELLRAGLVKLRSNYNQQKSWTTDLLRIYGSAESTARASRIGIWHQGDIGDTDDEA